jgi:hypothetical protein
MNEESIETLLSQLENEHPVFQNHVLEMARDAIEESYGPLPASDLTPVLQLLTLAKNHPSMAIAQLIASELSHRRRWEEVMAKYPDTLPELKRRIDG